MAFGADHFGFGQQVHLFVLRTIDRKELDLARVRSGTWAVAMAVRAAATEQDGAVPKATRFYLNALVDARHR